jgi:LPS export ABC transporter protein LptC
MEIFKKIWEKFKNLDKKKRAYLIILLSIICVMAWAFISAGVITCNFNRSQIEGAEEQQKVDAAGIIITETKDGKKYFEIYGETGSYNNEHNIATLNSVVGNFYKDGEVAMSFQSSKGTYDEKKGVITLYDHTYIVLKDETSLLADRLTWSGSDKDTIAEGNVQIKKGKEMHALADRCIIGSGYEKFKIEGKTRTNIYEKMEDK